ncbi:MAG: pentapeptide repeat-containing protein [Bacteroidales bacterium]|nr:pentapeptide repeat-containing protein [Bacteroidales bacterium]
MDTKILDSVFDQYGYELKEKCEQYRVYLLHQGMYYGAEIVALQEYDCSDIVSEYSKLGYAAKFHHFNAIEDAEKYLFDGFFKTTLTSNRIKKRYNDFASMQVKPYGNLGVAYEYINVPYSIIDSNEVQNGVNIVNDINSIFAKDGAYLMIIEAAAGFGKTCTAFEIYKSLEPITTNTKPLFAELSNNRNAKEFRYVLMSEIEDEFNAGINTDLVIHNIKRGKIPLLIDGFDELLSKNIDTGRKISTSDFEEVETMLSTIGDLLSDNAKIVITSRKTAIFSGDQFNEWVDSYESAFNVVRFQLEKPQILHWLTSEQIDILNTNNVPLDNITNPVLLTYLRNIDNNTLKSISREPDTIVDKYFEFLLNREQERQQLVIPYQDQMKIFQNLAKSFAEFDITAESRAFVKDLLIDRNKSKLSYYRAISSQKPSFEELADTLTNHALLDRIGNRDYIGFINEFIFGVLLGKSILEDAACLLRETIRSENIFEKIIYAFRYAKSSDKIKLHNILSPIRTDFSIFSQINFDALLRNKINGNFNNTNLNSIEFYDVKFDDCNFDTVIFTDITFSKCSFGQGVFENCGFIGCKFKECNCSNNSGNSNYCFGCKDYDSNFINTFFLSDNSVTEECENDDEKIVLSKYFKVDGKTPRMKTITSLRNELTINNLTKVLHKLENNGYIIINGNNTYISKDGIGFYNKYISK